MGSEGKIGKSLGSDLLKQKLTLPLIRLLQTASEQESQEIRQLLAHPDETTRSRLTPYFERSDAFSYTSRVAKNLASEARNQLELLPQTPARRITADIAEFAVQRTF